MLVFLSLFLSTLLNSTAQSPRHLPCPQFFSCTLLACTLPFCSISLCWFFPLHQSLFSTLWKPIWDSSVAGSFPKKRPLSDPLEFHSIPSPHSTHTTKQASSPWTTVDYVQNSGHGSVPSTLKSRPSEPASPEVGPKRLDIFKVPRPAGGVWEVLVYTYTLYFLNIRSLLKSWKLSSTYLSTLLK